MRRRHILGALLATTLPMQANAQYRPQRSEFDILRADVSTHLIDVQDVGTYRLFIARPYRPSGRILYLLDGNGAFDRVTAELLASAPGLAVVGVGYPTDLRFDTERRSLDYTPPLSDHPVPDPDRPERLAGGAHLFAPRLTGDLRAAAEDGFAVTHRTLWGHSFGGLFTLYTLFTRPDAFDRFVAISPSLWWGHGAAERLEADAAPLARPTVLQLANGTAEGRGRPKRGISQEAFAARLARHPNLSVQRTVFDGLAHGETLDASLPLAFRIAAE